MFVVIFSMGGTSVNKYRIKKLNQRSQAISDERVPKHHVVIINCILLWEVKSPVLV